MSECKCEVVSLCESNVFPPVSILVVADVTSHPMPSESASFFESRRKGKHPHAFIIKWVTLSQIQYVESYLLALASVAYSEEVPLGVAVSVNIILED